MYYTHCESSSQFFPSAPAPSIVFSTPSLRHRSRMLIPTGADQFIPLTRSLTTPVAAQGEALGASCLLKDFFADPDASGRQLEPKCRGGHCNTTILVLIVDEG